jgi:PAS domain-containing protein
VSEVSWSLAAEDVLLPTLRVRLDGHVVQANVTAARLFGRTPEQMAATTIEQLLSPGGRLLYHTQLIPALRMAGRASGLSLVVRDASGTEHRVVAHASLEDADGAAPSITLMLLPSRTGREMEDELLRIRRAADASPAMLFEYQVEAAGQGRFAYASAAIA